MNCIYLYLITTLKSVNCFSHLAGALCWMDLFILTLQELVLAANIVWKTLRGYRCVFHCIIKSFCLCVLYWTYIWPNCNLITSQYYFLHLICLYNLRVRTDGCYHYQPSSIPSINSFSSQFFCLHFLQFLRFYCTSIESFWLQKHIMASFRESIKALKEAGLADSEILEIIADSVDRQKNWSLSITKTLANRNNSRHELPTKDNKINAETPSVRKRKAGTFSTGKHPKSIRQGSPGLSWEGDKALFNNPFNPTVFPLSL